jgi:hypothetical protein
MAMDGLLYDLKINILTFICFKSSAIRLGRERGVEAEPGVTAAVQCAKFDRAGAGAGGRLSGLHVFA